MADQQLVDGPPAAKRPKVSSPSLTSSDNADIFRLIDDLPEELGDLDSSPGGPQNGAKEHGMHQPDQSQKHQQLSQLLSSNSSASTVATTNNSPQNHAQTSGHSPNVGLVNSLNSLNNTVKSPLSNNLSSPPPNIAASKGASGLTHSLNSDLIANSSAYNSIGTGNTVTSSPMISMPMVNSLNKSMTSQQLVSGTGQNLHQSQLVNGPQHLGMPGSGVSRSVPTTMTSLPGTFSQANMMGGTNMANTVAAGQLGGNQTGINHSGLANASQQPLLPAGPGGVGGQQSSTADPKKKKVPTATLR